MPIKRTKHGEMSGMSPKTTLSSLKASYPNGDGRELALVWRSDKAAIYKLCREGAIHGYEVFKIKVVKPYTRFGKNYPASEAYPGNEAFGHWAKSCATLERAEFWAEEWSKEN